MPAARRGIVLFGDVVDSRSDPAVSTAFLRTLCRELEGVYEDQRIASFGFTQGDELQGLLRVGADPFRAVIHGGLHPEYLPIRWAIAIGSIEPGRGPTTERAGEAFIAAREALDQARQQRDRLVVRTGDPYADGLLADLAPLFVELLDGLTAAQREASRLLVEDGLRQSEAAARLGVARATVSVVSKRARARSIARMWRALRSILGTGVAASAAADGRRGAA